MQLARARLGQSDLEITRVGVGTAPIGSTAEWRINWGPQDEGDAIRAIQTALDAGVNWIDTAPFYGWGRAERLVGEALAGRREQVYLFPKCGTLRDDGGGWHEDLSPASIRREIEASLRNLRTDHVDLYQFHDPDPAMPIERSWGTMQDLIAEGKVRWGGLSNHPPELVARALTVCRAPRHRRARLVAARQRLPHRWLPPGPPRPAGLSPAASLRAGAGVLAARARARRTQRDRVGPRQDDGRAGDCLGAAHAGADGCHYGRAQCPRGARHDRGARMAPQRRGDTGHRAGSRRLERGLIVRTPGVSRTPPR